MRLTQWTDNSLRVLMHCAAHEGRAQPTTIREVAAVHGISRSLLTKIVMTLAAQGFIETTRGRGGGMRLNRPAASITVGEVVRSTETDFQQFECFNRASSQCHMVGHCGLQQVVGRALASYLQELDRVTLAELIESPPARTGGAVKVQNPRSSWRLNVER